MKFPSNVTFANVESLLEHIQEGDAPNLFIPANRKNSALGGDAAFAQALLTWSASAASTQLEVQSIGDSSDLQRFASTFDGLIALSLPQTMLGGNRQEISRADARGAVDAALARINYPLSRIDLPPGPRVALVCVDHLNRGSPASLYKTGPEGRREPSERAFDVLSQILSRKLLQNQSIRAEIIPTISFCAFELFCNTHDHARFQVTDDLSGLASNRVERASIRGITARMMSVSDDAIDVVGAAAPALSQYLRRRSSRRARQSLSWFFELSVFDGGPGYAASLLGLRPKDIPFPEEVAAVRRCFSQQVGRKRVPGHGNGLADVGRELAKASAFFRLRTGRVSLCAALDGDPSTFNPDRIPLVDWQSAESAPTAMAPTTGTLFTFLIPLPEQHENNIQLPF